MNLHKLNSRKALTLIELLLAVSLMGFIMVTAALIEVDIRSYYFASDREGQLQLRLSYAMEHMAKNLSLVHSDLADPFHLGIMQPSGDSSITFQRDQAIGGVFTPQTYSDDVWMRYWLDGNQIKYCPNGGGVNCNVVEEVIFDSAATTLQFLPHLTSPQLNIEIILSGATADTPPVTANLRTNVFPRSYSNN